MRRPSSSSCLLLPKASVDEQDNNNNNENNNNNNNLSSPMSVTILNKEKLPTYSTERFYMLSEIEINSQSILYFCNLVNNSNNSNDNSTQTTEETTPTSDGQQEQQQSSSSTNTAATNEDNDNDSNTTKSNNNTSFPPFLILYMLWNANGVNETNDPNEFVEKDIIPLVQHLQEQQRINLVRSIDNTTNNNYTKEASFRLVPNNTNDDWSPRRIPESKNKNDKDDTSTNNNNESKQQVDAEEERTDVSLYIVVDRVKPFDSINISKSSSEKEEENIMEFLDIDKQKYIQFNNEEQISEQLARVVASNTYLRQCTEGITVGISNHIRAAPGLDIITKAITYGSIDRRRYANNNKNKQQKQNKSIDNTKSLIGIIAAYPDIMLGIENKTNDDDENNNNENVTDSVQGILQSYITAEWNGQGPLLSYSYRAHNQWKILNNLPIDNIMNDMSSNNNSIRRRIPSLSRRKQQQQQNAVVKARNNQQQRNRYYYHDYSTNNNNDSNNFEDIIIELLGWFFVIFYILFHFR